MMPKTPKGIRGFLIDTPDAGRVRGIRNGAILLEDGAIVAAGPYDESGGRLARMGFAGSIRRKP